MKTSQNIKKNIKTTINHPDQTFLETDTAIFSVTSQYTPSLAVCHELLLLDIHQVSIKQSTAAL